MSRYRARIAYDITATIEFEAPDHLTVEADEEQILDYGQRHFDARITLPHDVDVWVEMSELEQVVEN